jgi:ABC-type multidrug transport system ATPase subunit
MIILDEPLITLDDKTRETFFTILEERSDKLFLISSHQSLDVTRTRIDTTFKIQNQTLVAE